MVVGIRAIGGGKEPSKPRPNIVLIVTDDQRADTMSVMPRVRSLLGGHGVTFPNAFVTTSLCCPSRASIFTGLASRHTGVYTDRAPDGGATVFHDRSTVATWLHRAGYATGLVGKYLNDYSALGPKYIPPGWDVWDSILTEPQSRYYDFALSENGRVVRYGDIRDYRKRVQRGPQAEALYSTNVQTDLALKFIRGAKRPFFLYLAPNAPHLPAIPAPQDVGSMSNLPKYAPPSFNERYVADKPWQGEIPLLGKSRQHRQQKDRRRILATLVDVDRSVERVVEALQRRRVLDNTVIIYTSDNGLLLGEHRIDAKKVWPYEESIRVPLVIRLPWQSPPGRVLTDMALNIDLAPTVAQLAGVRPGLEEDGRSLVPLLRPGPSPPPWRKSFVVEYLGGLTQMPYPPDFEAVRTERYLWVEYRNGWRELYDLKKDPYELRNEAGKPSSAGLRRRLHGLLQGLLKAPPGTGT